MAQTHGELDSEGGLMITPEKGYVIKTIDTSNGAKVFLNMTAHPIVEPPEQTDEAEQTSLRVPLSLGDPKCEFDNKGEPCAVYDIIWNPEVLQKSLEDPTYRRLLVELCVNYVQQKFKQILSMKYKKMPTLDYKGKTVSKQRVRGKKRPQVEIINEEVFKQEQTNTPEWEVFLDGQALDAELLPNCQEIRIDVKLPLLITGGKINLRISEERIELQVARFYSLQLWTPLNISTDTSKAEFDVQDRVLKIIMPVKREEETTPAPEEPVKLNPVEISSHKMLFDIS